MLQARRDLARPDRPRRLRGGHGDGGGDLVHLREDRVVGAAQPVREVLDVRLDGVHVVAVVDRQDEVVVDRRWRHDLEQVQHAQLLGQLDRVPDPAGTHGVVMAEVVPGQLLGVDQPTGHRPAPLSRRTGRHRGRPGRLGQGPAAVSRRLHRPQERGAHLVVLQHLDRGRRRAARRGDPLAQHRRVLAGLAQHRRRPEHRLHDQLGGDVAGQSQVHPGLDHRLDDEEQVRRTRARDGGDRILVALRHRDHPAGGRQDLGHVVEVLGAGVRAGRDRRHALVDQSGGVRHHPDDRQVAAESGLDERRVHTGRERDDQRAGPQRPGDLAEQLAHVLRLDHQDHRVRRGRGLVVLQHGDAVPLDQVGLPLRPSVRGHDAAGVPARPDQAGQDGLAHHARTEDRQDGRTGAWSATIGHVDVDLLPHRRQPCRSLTSCEATSSAIWTAFSAAPLRRLSLLMNSTRPRPSGTD